MPEPHRDFRVYLPLANKVANKWAARMRNWSYRDDFYQVASAEIWWQHLRYDSSLDFPVEAVLYKRAEGAVQRFLSDAFGKGPRVLLTGGWEDEYGFEFVESLGTPIEEIGGRPVFDRSLAEKVQQFAKSLPMVQRAVIERRFFEEKTVSEVAEELGVPADHVLDAECAAMAEIRQGLGLAAPKEEQELNSDLENMKECAHCRDPKPISEFNRQNGVEGGHSYCKSCAIRVSQEALFRRRAEAKKRWRERAKREVKLCCFCKRELPFSHFLSDGRTKDGLSLGCDDCQGSWASLREGNAARGVRQPSFARASDKTVYEANLLCRRGRLCLGYPRLGEPARAVPGNGKGFCDECQAAKLTHRARGMAEKRRAS